MLQQLILIPDLYFLMSHFPNIKVWMLFETRLNIEPLLREIESKPTLRKNKRHRI